MITAAPTNTAAPFAPERLQQIETLARLGFTVTAAHVEVILDLQDGELQRWIQTPEGARHWKRWRTEARAELLQTIQQQALAGDHNAQRLLATLYERDDTAKPAEIRLPGRDVAELIGRTPRRLRARVMQGEFTDPGPDGKYALAVLMALYPALWDKLDAARERIAQLEALSERFNVNESAARTAAAMETARRRKRENDVAEGILVDLYRVQDQVWRLCSLVREQSRNLIEELKLKTAATRPAAAMMDAARTAFLQRCSRCMQTIAHAGPLPTAAAQHATSMETN